jgi:polyisoprenoid-binding protein YceI
VSDSEADLSAADEPDRSRTKRIVMWVVIGVVAVVALGYGAIFLYTEVLNDSPDALDETDLAGALVDDTDADGAATTSNTTTSNTSTSDGTSPTADAPNTTPDTTAEGADETDFDGDWVATEASEFGYRVEEVLAGVNTTAVGRSNQIDGALTIDGTTATAVDVTVDVASIESDDGRRDGQFQGRIMSADEFPTATFVLTEPIEFGSIPTGDETITASATGDLTLRGVTNSVTFDVTAQTTGGRVGVLGSIPVVFADYGIDNPSFAGVQTEDHGLVEFVLVFERA